MLLMPSLYLTALRMSRTFFRCSEPFGSTWMVSSFFLSTRTSKSPRLILDGLIIPLSEPNVKNFFRVGRFFLDVRYTRDLMRDSKGRTARSYFPTVHELIIAQPDMPVKKKVLSFSFFFWHGFFRIRMYPNYFLIFLLTFPMRRGKIDHLLACTDRKFPGKSS